MKPAASQTATILSSILIISLSSGCAKINLGGSKGGQGAANQQAANQNAQPPLDGEWEVDYEYKGNTYIGNATLSQEGNAFAGAGQDQDGREWQLLDGVLQGQQISFKKQYAGSKGPPVTYTGELKFLQTPEYTGWCMEGTYSAQSSGGTVSGKWVANPTAPPPEAAVQEAPAQPQTQTQQAAVSADRHVENLGDIRPADISGHYMVSYQYNFQKIKSEIWLKNDGKNLSGDGKDVIGKESEYFTIPKGWYDYPKVTLIRQYTKGKGAKESRKITFKATITSNGRDINMSGETQYGGHWQAKLVR